MTELTERSKALLKKNAWIEVVCGTDHLDIKDRSCSRVRVYHHACHLCTGYRLFKAATPPKERVCPNCLGPLIPSGEPSCFPDLVVVDDWID